jgi:hypothetical protein
MTEPIGVHLRRRRDAAHRLPPLRSGYGDPLTRLAHRPPKPRPLGPRTVLLLSHSLAALRRAWLHADPDDRHELARVAALLKEIAR